MAQHDLDVLTMGRRAFRHALAGLAFLAMTVAFQASPAQALDGAGLVASSFDLEASSGVGYRIFTAVPVGKAPAGGFPVVYLIDGNMTFPIAEAVLAGNPEMKAVLVGIGYPTGDRNEIVRLRYFDLTPRTPAELIPLAKGMSPPETGGRDAFLSFLEDQLKPAIEQRLPVDRTRQTIFGHSLGGLFALHVLFSRPDAFRTYAAADPSIWWNGRSILKEQASFLRAPTAGEGKRLLIETSGKKGIRPGTDAAAADRLAKLRSGPTGRDVHHALKAASGIERAFRNFPQEGHGSMVTLAVADALRFALLGAVPGSGDGGHKLPNAN